MAILQSKLEPPRRLKVLRRERLVSRLHEAGRKKLIAVTAGAGFGKTTLVLDALSDIAAHILWYRIDEQDRDLPVFMSYLFALARHHFHGSQEINERKAGAIITFSNKTDQLIEWLAFLEEYAMGDTYIIFDDFHLISESEAVHRAVEFIMNRLPGHIHIVIISRKKLPLKLATLRSRELLMEINERDLAFTSDEIESFYKEIYHLDLGDAHIRDIHKATSGWAASLVLLRYALKSESAGDVAKTLHMVKNDPEFIFSYLEENVFQSQPEHIRSFMLKAAIPEVIDIRLCCDFFDSDQSEAVLKRMADDHLMIFPVDESGNVYTLHHLFRDFLLLKLKKTVPAAEIKAMHIAVARILEKNNFIQALHHYIEGHAYDDAARLIKQKEIDFLIERRLNFLESMLEKIPHDVILENPRLLMAKAMLLTYYGKSDQARYLLTQALKGFKRLESRAETAQCLVETGSNYYSTGHVREAKLLMEQVLNDVDGRSATYGIVMTYLIFLSSVLGDFNNAENYYKSACDNVSYYPDFERQATSAMLNTSYTYTKYIQGDFEESGRLNAKLLKLALELKIEGLLPLVYYQYAANDFFLGEYERGMDYAEKGLDVCDRIDLHDSKKAWILIAYAQNCIGLNHLDKALDLLNKSIELFEEPGNRWGLANAWHAVHLVYMAKGRPKAAKKMIIKAMEIIRDHELTLTEGILENSLADLLIMENDVKSALDYLIRSETKVRGASFYVFENHYLFAYAYSKNGERRKACDHLKAALSIAEEKNYDRFLTKGKKRLALLLQQLDYKGLDSNYISNIIGKTIHNEPPVLEICFLGPFKMTIGGEEVPLSRWKSAKALMLLKYLGAKKDLGFIHREILIEMLWPEEDLVKTAKRFNMAMSTLRKTLEPGISPKAPSRYIERKKDAYRLYPGKGGASTDLELFVSSCRDAERLGRTDAPKALERYKHAMSLYHGPFLEEDPYEEWCMEMRRLLHNEYTKALHWVHRFYERNKDVKNCVKLANHILRADPADEEIRLNLMRHYAALGDVAKAASEYKAYLDFSVEADIPINREIEALYRELVRKN